MSNTVDTIKRHGLTASLQDQRFDAAVEILRRHAGDAIADAIDREHSYETRGTDEALWILCSVIGSEVATIGALYGSVVLHSLADEQFALGELQSLRVICSACRQPRVLIGADIRASALHFKCRNEQCGRFVYVLLDR